ncbi:MAG: exodeoxyribonuclease VII small subunit [Desulfobacteraceae bacterium]|jgi:exodeoxyribonuclease VII small subunit|nr:exodeoxyribonuclease VII small subunit [Desulfobacteraceae bacterium]
MATKPAVNELSYEQAFAELEQIIASLESDERTLEEALRQYERGQALVQRCATLLEEAELRVQKLSGAGLAAFEGE